MKVCLHIHSEYSHDSKIPVRKIIEYAKSLGYDVIAITDHNTVRGSIEAKKYGDNKIKIIPGAEFSTQYGHILAYFIDDSIEKNTPRITKQQYDFYELVKNVKHVNGLLILAHPFNSRLKEKMEILRYLDGIERYNSRIDSFYWRRKSEKLIRTLLNQENLTYLAGTDAHSLEELKHCFVVTEDFELTTDSFKKALSKKNIIYYKPNVNFNIARAKFHNTKHISPKFLMINGVRFLFGIIENIYNKTTGCRQYETLCFSKENQSKI
ncbi:MAG: PHP domain-containing protein [Epulopiscium sp.]|nr:PHP domain-containing protein [Candidatus Epulonipiscium sp.]HOQ17667.1 PHP domain-containing protein [Defluviitaleaceae bacterium]